MSECRRALCAALTVAATTASADDGAGNHAIWGVGGGSCNQFLSAGDGDDEPAAYKHFVMGYLTAYNWLQDNTYNALGEMSLEDAIEWLTGYCDLHKLDSFERAIVQLVVARHEQRLQRPPGAARSWGAPAATQREPR